MASKTTIGAASLAGAGAAGGGAWYASTFLGGGSEETNVNPEQNNKGSEGYEIPNPTDYQDDFFTNVNLNGKNLTENKTTNNPYDFGTFNCAKKYFGDQLDTDLKHENGNEQIDVNEDWKDKSKIILEEACVVAETHHLSNNEQGDALILKAEFAGQNKEKDKGLLVETIFSSALENSNRKALHRFVYLKKEGTTWKAETGFEIEQDISWNNLSFSIRGRDQNKDDVKLEINKFCAKDSCNDVSKNGSEWKTKSVVGYWHKGPEFNSQYQFEENHGYQSAYKAKYPNTLMESFSVTNTKTSESKLGFLFWVDPLKENSNSGTKVSRVYKDSKWYQPKHERKADFYFPYGNIDNAYPFSAYGIWQWKTPQPSA